MLSQHENSSPGRIFVTPCNDEIYRLQDGISCLTLPCVDWLKEIGAAIRRAREDRIDSTTKRSWTQEKLGQMAKVSKSTITKVEAGTAPNLPGYAKAAAVLGLDIAVRVNSVAEKQGTPKTKKHGSVQTTDSLDTSLQRVNNSVSKDQLASTPQAQPQGDGGSPMSSVDQVYALMSRLTIQDLENVRTHFGVELEIRRRDLHEDSSGKGSS